MLLRRCLILFFTFCTYLAGAQEVRLELGFNGQVVANRWNPVVLELRNHPEVTLRLQIDQGNLREGEIPIFYEARLPRSQGFSHFEDEVYLPEWRNISWVVESSERILASGSLGRRQVDSNKLTLILSNNLSSWIDLLPNKRVTEALSHQLPENVAAYDGVESLILDGTVTTPSPEAIVSAVTSGTTLVFFEPLPRTYDALRRLADQGSRLGAGSIISLDRNSFSADHIAPEAFDPAQLVLELEDESLTTYPELSKLGPVFIFASLFCLATLLIFRFLPSTALSTSIVLSLIASILAWSWLKPFPEVREQSRTLIISGGELAFQQGMLALVSLPAEQRLLPYGSRLNKPFIHKQGPDFTNLELGRWSDLIIYQKPRLTQASFSLIQSEGEVRLRNTSSTPLSNVYVMGKGWQGALPADSQIPVREGSTEPLPPQLERLGRHLPVGTALAETQNLVLVALPERSP